jgi:hypothetical protein
MRFPHARRTTSLVSCSLLLSVAIVGCGATPADEVSSVGGAPTSSTSTPSSTSAPDGEAGATTTAEPPVSTAVPPVPPSTTSSTTTAPPPPEGTAASPVEGLSAAELRAAVEIEPSGAVRRLGGPTLESVRTPQGATVLRVRIPGPFPVRAARVEVLVGDRTVGEGIVAPDLSALTAVTLDGSGLVAGAPVSYRWEGAEPVAVGPLGVVR